MARVTVEDCVDKVPNRFELVLLSAHRARSLAGGQPLTVDRDNDKNPVVALREIADATIVPHDLLEDYIHSIQKYVEVDEPEADAAPVIAAETRTISLGRDDRNSDTAIDRVTMSEEELLRGMESMVPIESSTASAKTR